MFYKTLVDGKSHNGGQHEWSLPQLQPDGSYAPGAWHELPADIPLEICQSGFHLTSDPKCWWANNCTVWTTEYEGETTEHKEDKIAVRKVRLLRPALDSELEPLGIFRSGRHSVKEGKYLAGGNASVEAWGNASVKAWGNASVEAWGNASVKAWGSASVKAWGSASVEAWGSASVKAGGNASVKAWGSASVRMTYCCGEVHGDPKVELTGSRAVLIDQRTADGVLVQVGGKPYGDLAAIGEALGSAATISEIVQAIEALKAYAHPVES